MANVDHYFDLYSSKAFLSVNKELLQSFGPEPAIFISNLIDKRSYFKSKKLISDEWFYHEHAHQMKATGMTEHAIRRCKKIFIEKEILFIKKKGLPAKEWYRIDVEQLHKTIKNRLGQDLMKTEGLEDMKTEGLYIKETKLKELGKINKKKDFFGKTSKEIVEEFFPKEFHTKKFFKEWKDWTNYRNEINKKPSTQSIRKQVKLLSSYSPEEAIEIIDNTIRNGWTGLFIPKKFTQKEKPTKEYNLTRSQQMDIDRIKERLPDLKFTDKLMQGYFSIFNAYQKVRDEIIEEDKMFGSNKAGRMPALFYEYADYLAEDHNILYANEKAFDLKSPMFARFMKQLENSYGFSIKIWGKKNAKTNREDF